VQSGCNSGNNHSARDASWGGDAQDWGSASVWVLTAHLMFYAAAPRYAFRRNACITVEIAPLVVLSVLAILGMFIFQGTIWVPLPTFCDAMNTGGAAADLWMISKPLYYSKTAYIINERDGFKVLTEI
jgi:hypothetical protein